MIATYYVTRVKRDDGFILYVCGKPIEVRAKGYMDAARKSGLHGKLSVGRKGNFYSRPVEV